MSLLVTPFLMQACRHILPDVEGSPVQARCRPVPWPANYALATCCYTEKSCNDVYAANVMLHVTLAERHAPPNLNPLNLNPGHGS